MEKDNSILALESYYNVEEAIKLVLSVKNVQRNYIRRYELEQVEDKLTRTLNMLSTMV
jgi:hypothetical protein